MKRLLTALMISVLFCGVLFVSTVKASTEVSGVIGQDTTWTKAGSPYTITGKTLVSNGVTLTIEPGVTVNMNYDSNSQIYLQINGTLIARGTENEKIFFNGGKFKFTPACASYNEQTGSGCIIENSIITSNIERCLTIQNCSLKIVRSVINCPVFLDYCSAIVSNNQITGSIYISGGRSVISNNIITTRGIILDSRDIQFLISGNTISDCDIAVSLLSGYGPFDPSYLVIQNNMITKNRVGIFIGGMVSATIYNNTIADNKENGVIILDFAESNHQIKFNNLQNNGKYNLNLGQWSAHGIDAAYNWWGTTDIASINQTIYDFKNNFDLGIVNFIPFLTEPNPYTAGAQDLPTITSMPTPTVSTSQNSPIPTQSAQTPDASNFNIESNSTITAFSFDTNVPQISFYVNGPEGTTGYVKIIIAKTLMPNADQIQVYLDGSQINRDVTSNGDFWAVTFTYHHSSHQVTINTGQNTNNSSLPSWVWNAATIAIAIGIAAAVCIIVWLAKRSNQT
jgi:parallel beta-helix repeat protein